MRPCSTKITIFLLALVCFHVVLYILPLLPIPRYDDVLKASSSLSSQTMSSSKIGLENILSLRTLNLTDQTSSSSSSVPHEQESQSDLYVKDKEENHSGNQQTSFDSFNNSRDKESLTTVTATTSSQSASPLEKKKAPHKRIVEQLRVPTPIIVMSLPKSGTTSLYKYFNCGGVYSTHTYGKSEAGHGIRLGKCFHKNYMAQQPLFQNCVPYARMYSDIGYINMKEGGCFYPSLQAVDEIIRDYPNATIIVSYRSGWHDSILHFQGLRDRWRRRCPHIFPNSTNPEVWEEFYVAHRTRIRQAVEASSSSIRYLEFDLKDPLAGQKLENFTGISWECWADCKPNLKCDSPVTPQ